MKHNNVTGFTLIELLLVIMLIGVLAGVVLSVVNPIGQRHNAEDGVRRSNMNKLVTGIESFRVSEGAYPTETEKTNTSSKLYSIYLARWPDGEPITTDIYEYSQVGTNFGLLINKTASPGCIKYRSEWGKIQDCTNCSVSNTGC